MKKQIPVPPNDTALRQNAEELLKRRKSSINHIATEADMLKLIHELDVHQIELEMQNNELQLAKKQFEEISERYIELYDFAPSGYFTLSKNGKIVELNLCGAKLLGKERSLLTGKPFALFVSESSIQIFNRFIEEVFKSNVQESCEVSIRNNEESQIYVHLTGIKTEDEETCLVTAVDITLRKQEELHYCKLFSEILDGFALFTIRYNERGNPVDFRFLSVNSAFERMTGFKANDLLGKSWPEVIPQYEPNLLGTFLKVATTGEPKLFEIVSGAFGKSFEVNAFTPVPGQLACFLVDITERKNALEKLVEREEQYRRSFEYSPVPFLVAKNSGELVLINKNFIDTYGYTLQEIPTLEKWFELAYPDAGYRNFVLNDWEEAVGNARQNKMPVQNREYLLNCKNGDVRTVSVSAYIEEDVCIFLYQDFTDKKHAEVELIKAKEKAEEYDHLKSAFLANMSHEIRTPMNGILGFTRLLREPDLSGEAQQEYIRLIEKSGERMLNIINDIIDISKIESRVMKVNLTETNINNAIEYVYTFFRPETDRKGIKLIYTNSLPHHEAVIMTDREKLYSILTNLLKNAIKFTDKGTIEFGYQISYASPEEIEFFVKDTGIGIPKNRQNAIFERFIQADISDTRALQGAGLGLSISKAYVEMIGGRMWVESTEGKGSSFHFTVPVIHSVPESMEVTTDIEKRDQDIQSRILKILIVEDDEISERLIRIGIQKYGKEILEAGTGTEAIEVCRKNPDIDLILMDIKLPEINGYEATRRIRQFNTDVIIIAQTAYGLSGDREKALQAGCNDYISKPFAPSIISHLIKKYFPV